MSKDLHLNTGEYDPEKYWDARVNTGKNTYQAVCCFNCTDEINKAAENLQLRNINKIIKNIKLTNKKILEFGCGVGRLANNFIGKGAIYNGVDISQRMIDQAKKQNIAGNFYKINSTKLPFATNTFDLVFTVTVLHHNPYPEQKKIIDELTRVAKPGAYILLQEDIVPDKGVQTSFNMFPRTIDGWLELFDNNQTKIINTRLHKYSTLYNILKRPFDKYKKANINNTSLNNKKKILNIVTKLGNYIDPCLLLITPDKYMRVATILIKKNEYTKN